jgi:rhodanese-related sulfurtransferase
VSEELELTPQRVAELVEKGEAELVDVRTDEEREAARLPGSRHIPIESLAEQVSQLSTSKPVVFYCRSGDRSGAAADALVASGREAYNLSGGIVAWSEAGLPVEPEGAEVRSPSGLPPA